MASRLCPYCMQMTDSETCPHCGKNVNYAGSPAHLPAGYVVSGKHPYVLGASLGQGGFGITYIALDMVTNQRVAIKEYYPTYCSIRSDASTVTAYSNQEEVYQKGKERFLDEAKTLKSLSDLKSIVNVLDFFGANNTAYLVMEFLDGSSLKEYAAKNGKFPAQKFLKQIEPLMEDIHRMHERGVIHRDIAPDNIILQPDGQMRLIDFGAARSYIGDKSMTVVVKKGFAPVEQYFSTGSTASSDVYALAATIYYCITGVVPMDSALRQSERKSLTSPASLGADISPRQEKALLKALEIQQKNRTQSMLSLLNNLKIKQPEAPKPEQPKPEKPKPEKPEKPKPEKPKKAPKPKVSRNPPKEKPPKTVENAQSPKKLSAIIAAAILVVIAVFGFVLLSGGPEKPAEQLQAETAASIPAQEPAPWEKNVLMADDSFEKDFAAFWAERGSASRDEIDTYFSSRPIFNTGIARSEVNEVFFLDSLSTAPKKVYDVSANQDRTVLAWTEKNETGALSLYIAGEGGINGEKACHSLFSGYIELESVHFNNSLFTDTVRDMGSMFRYCSKLTSLDLSSLNTSQVTSMEHMFGFCTQLVRLDLSSFDTAQVTNMGYMFSQCLGLMELNLSSFNTSSVTSMPGMFTCCRSLKSLDLRHFDTANVTDMSRMFSYMDLILSIDISSFSTSRVTDMQNMFQNFGHSNFKNLDLDHFDTANVTDMSNMFDGCRWLSNLDLSSFDTSKVENYENFMDEGKTVNGRPWQELFAPNTNHTPSPKPSSDTPVWRKNLLMPDTSFREDQQTFQSENPSTSMDEYYDYLANRPVFNTDIPRREIKEVFFLDSLSTAPQNVYDVSARQDETVLAWTEKNNNGLNLYIAGEGGVNGEKACQYLFAGYTGLEAVHFNNSFFTDHATTMTYMFSYCIKLKAVDMRDLNTSNVTDMIGMFTQCEQLKTIDLSTLNTSNVTDMSSMFSGCANLASLDLHSFDTARVTSMMYMFSQCRQLKTLNLSSFNTSNVKYMGNMFFWCSRLTNLDLSNFDFSNVEIYDFFMDSGKKVNGRPWEELFE